MKHAALRIAAYLIDVALVYAFFALTQNTVFAPLRMLGGGQWLTSGALTELYVLLTVSLPVWLYFILMERSAWQGSLGKRLLRLRVCSLTNERLSVRRTLLRTGVKMLPWETAHLIVNLPASMWINPATGALDFTGDVAPWRMWLFILPYALVAIYLLWVLLSKGARSADDWVARTEVAYR